VTKARLNVGDMLPRFKINAPPIHAMSMPIVSLRIKVLDVTARKASLWTIQEVALAFHLQVLPLPPPPPSGCDNCGANQECAFGRCRCKSGFGGLKCNRVDPYYVVNSIRGCFDIPNGSAAGGTQVKQVLNCPGNPNQAFGWISLDKAILHIPSGMCMQVLGSGDVVLSICTGQNDQKWDWPVPEIKNSGKCLDAEGAYSGAKLVVKTCDASSTQRWGYAATVQDLCTANSCHINADCITKDKGVGCYCKKGFNGDGKTTCTGVSPPSPPPPPAPSVCSANGGCDLTATCKAAGTIPKCTCPASWKNGPGTLAKQCWKCIQSCTDFKRYLLVRDDRKTISCQSRDARKCSFYSDKRCTKLATGSLAPVIGKTIGLQGIHWKDLVRGSQSSVA
jgi:hypothetical protein